MLGEVFRKRENKYIPIHVSEQQNMETNTIIYKIRSYMHGLTQPSTSLLKMGVRDNPNEKGPLYLKQKLMILLSEYLKVRAAA